ncbi:MAG: response regulator transcription factor [Proteobacteria bacterium]|nr:response regulator transcription factor [Pseudomonadota bacterium]
MDDHASVRRGFALLINEQKDLQVCGEAAGVVDGLECVTKLKPDLAIVDITLKEGNGIELVKEMRRRKLKSRILVVSMHEESVFAERAIRAGANGYIMKHETPECLIKAVRRVIEGKVYLNETISAELLENMVGAGLTGRASVEDLSDRELEVLGSIGEGLNTAEIAGKLHISPKTVDTYRMRLKVKLNLDTSAHLLRYAIHWKRERQR